MDRRIFIEGSVIGTALTAWPMGRPSVGSTLAPQRTLFTADWKFYKGDAEGAEAGNFNDSDWRSLALPHDWAIEGPFDVKYNARCGGLPFHGTGWYRKTFDVPEAARGSHVYLTFEGAMYNAHVWVNGTLVGHRPFGYIEFQYDIAPYLRFGAENTIAVRLTPEDLSTRWYPGAGIYRDVWLEFRNPVHVKQWGVYVTTPQVSNEAATVAVKTELVGAVRNRPVTIRQQVMDAEGRVVATDSVSAAANQEQMIPLRHPRRWDLDDPYLYTLVTTVLEDDQVVDEVINRFGIRTLTFAKEVFKLNGKAVRIQGVCLHHDNGPLGAVANRRAIERKLEIMKEMGVNSIRTAHNPPSTALLELCDEMGLLVQDEAFDVWNIAKVPNGYNKYFADWSERDLKDMVRRDRNHPSVFMWSIGNEILEQREKEGGPKLARSLHQFVREVDATRPTTCGFNWWPYPYETGMANQVDIPGMNYKPLSYGEPVNEYVGDRPVIGSETSSCTSSRGVYHLPIERYKTHPSKQVSSYDIVGPPWAYPPDVEFSQLEKNPEIYGEYIWTGFDYLGEPTPYGGKDNSTNGYWNEDWPSRSSYFGAVDLCGLPKDRFYLYQSQWTNEPMVHLLPHWNWAGSEHTQIPVFSYTNCEEVELFLNGRSLGRKVKGKDLVTLPVTFLRYEGTTFNSPYRLGWDVEYEAGALKAVGYIGGRAVVEKEIRTAGAPARVRLIPDRSVLKVGAEDLSYVTVRIEDEAGNLCPVADNRVTFSVDGAGSIAAVGNGNAATTDPFHADYRDAFSGMCMLIVRAGNSAGPIAVKAHSVGLSGDEVRLAVK